ncbi:hypothetical protein [Mobilicoccus massiliensis]|uniref:hypothetical protein n=1 Tax=Mobilicoccus massiliensis TaxID=1522310 RepID=UPI00058E8DC5|nr:hypothetical protein [Mobilicoccus massiliensis]
MTFTTQRPHRRHPFVSPEIVARIEAADATSADGEAACASARALGIPATAWTPEIEADTVPRTLMAICESCPVWSSCLREAIRMNDVGYRASTTTAQRRSLFPELVNTRTADLGTRVADIGIETERRPRHPRGEGSLSRYRRGCRCDECRGHNAAARRRERARAS